MANTPFDSGYNPYAPPIHDGPAMATPRVGGNYERVGDVLVVAKDTTLPLDVCIATGRPSDGQPVNKKLYWANPLLALTIFIHVLVYLIVYLVVRKSGSLTYAFSSEFRSRRLFGILLAVIGPIVCLFLTIFGATENQGVLIAVGMIGLLGTLIAGSLMAQPFRIKKIDEHYIHLKLKPEVFAALGL